MPIGQPNCTVLMSEPISRARSLLQGARAGADVVFHAFFADDECAQALLKSGTSVAPTLTFLRNNIEFSQAHEPSIGSGYVAMRRRVVDIGCRNLRRLYQAGVPFMTGSDAGFAVTPYGEWHYRLWPTVWPQLVSKTAN